MKTEFLRKAAALSFRALTIAGTLFILILLPFTRNGIAEGFIFLFILFLCLVWALSGWHHPLRTMMLSLCLLFAAGYWIDARVVKKRARQYIEKMAKSYPCAPELNELLQRNDGWRQFHYDARKEIHSLLATTQLIYRNNRMYSGIGLDAIDHVQDFAVCTNKPDPVPSPADR